ncbi:taste receptor type 1 member 1 isoform X2 [Talpa occidentalis]|uniref:taste receptor type 1 member 1 isoform X2 n=1 Tax=Talpa occidentalis TaxID=50954 RepID=UPI00188F20E6|nr:taste receptor type 1 member 1 isoform X2 [Talpa occidentalis]
MSPHLAHQVSLLLSLSCCWACSCHDAECSPGFSLPGDYLLAGLFSIHAESLGVRHKPTVTLCDRPNSLNGHGYHHFQAMRFAVQEINNSTALLPNVTLGYEIYDVCSESANVYAALSVLSLLGTHLEEVPGNLSHSPMAVAVIGPDTTKRAATTAALLSPFLVPLISYEASSEILTASRQYPSFLRTLPSDEHQVEVMVLLLWRFRRHLARVFFESVVLANLTAKVWIASEDWAISRHISKVPGIWRIGTVLGVAIRQRSVPGLQAFEEASVRADQGARPPCPQGPRCSCNQLCRECQAFTEHTVPTLGAFSMSSAYNVYRAVYAAAHGLHQLLGCASGACSRGRVDPGELLEQIRKVNFPLYGDSLAFNDKGDPLSGYDIIAWNWIGLQWNFSVIGSSTWSPVQLDIDETKIQWHGKDNQVPTSVCSSDCPEGHQRVIMGFFHCCFECVPCEAGTFLNKSDPHSCQPCGKEEWAPKESQTCFPRTVVFLTWHEPISWVLLAANTLLLLLLAGTVGLFARHLDTPVVRSAGGRLCFLMLGSLAGGSCSLYGFFGEPTLPMCLMRQALFSLSFAIFLSCLTIRSFQLVFIFKFSTKLPMFYQAWVQNHGAGLFVVISSTAQLLICLTWLAVWTPLPTRDYQRFPQLVVLDCTEANSVGFMLAFAYNACLLVSAFACSYLGKDLPENYNEAKCVTFSLLLNFVTWIAFFTMTSVYQGQYLTAVNVLAALSSLSSGFSGYFLPKCYVILRRPDLNSTEHFQASIQDYTRRCGSS